MLTLEVISWIAVAILSFSYWLQIWKIHVHREVRDISMPYYIMLAIGFGILGVTAFVERSWIFIVKQVATFIPCVVIIGQVVYHRKDRWHDPALPFCSTCHEEIEQHWEHCPYCGAETQIAT